MPSSSDVGPVIYLSRHSFLLKTFRQYIFMGLLGLPTQQISSNVVDLLSIANKRELIKRMEIIGKKRIISKKLIAPQATVVPAAGGPAATVVEGVVAGGGEMWWMACWSGGWFESMSFVVNILACKLKIVNNRN